MDDVPTYMSWFIGIISAVVGYSVVVKLLWPTYLLSRRKEFPELNTVKLIDYREDLLTEYEKTQDSAQHHDTLGWSMTSIFWAGNLALLGFVLDKDISVVRGIFAGILGIFLSICVFIFGYQFNWIKNQKYERCKAIERVLGLRQHNSFISPTPRQNPLHTVLSILLVVTWCITVGTIVRSDGLYQQYFYCSAMGFFGSGALTWVVRVVRGKRQGKMDNRAR